MKTITKIFLLSVLCSTLFINPINAISAKYITCDWCKETIPYGNYYYKISSLIRLYPAETFRKDKLQYERFICITCSMSVFEERCFKCNTLMEWAEFPELEESYHICPNCGSKEETLPLRLPE